jgi:hypothetical protein
MGRDQSNHEGQPFGPKGRDQSKRYYLPDVAGIAYIPYDGWFHRCTPGWIRQRVSTIGCPSAYRDHPLERGAGPGRLFGHAFCKLFATGNLQEPVDEAFASPEPYDPQWTRKFKPVDVRAAVRLSDLCMYVDQAGDVEGLTGVGQYMVGATPAGIGALLPHIPFRGPRLGHSGSIRLGADWDSENAWVRRDQGHWVAEQGIRFRIGHLGDWIGRQLTTAPAPWAFMAVRFSVRGFNGRSLVVRITARGSGIPSTRWWVSGRRNGGYSMASLPSSDIDAFIYAGNAEDPDERIPPSRHAGHMGTVVVR